MSKVFIEEYMGKMLDVYYVDDNLKITQIHPQVPILNFANQDRI